MISYLLVYALLQHAPEPLTTGLAHDRQMVRQTCEDALSRLVNHDRKGAIRVSLERIYSTTSDAEVRRRLSRILNQYVDITPSGEKGIFPRIDTLAGPPKGIGLPKEAEESASALFYSLSQTIHLLSDQKNVDSYRRMQMADLARELVRMGANRWAVQRKLDYLLRAESFLGIAPAKPVSVLEPE